MYEVSFSDELIFCVGAAVFVGSVLCFVLFSLFFYIRKIKLNGQFEREYGSRLGKDGRPTEQKKRKRKDAG